MSGMLETFEQKEIELMEEENKNNANETEEKDNGGQGGNNQGGFYNPFSRWKPEELAVEGCVCVALLSVATAALSLLLLKNK